MYEWIFDYHIWLSLITLTFLEIILGIDNVVFIAIATEKLPSHLQKKARFLGLMGAMMMRILFLFMITWVISLKKPIITVGDFDFSWRDLILHAGGLFLIVKGTLEIHAMVEPDLKKPVQVSKASAFFQVIFTIMVMDMIFSIDSILTAIGMTDKLGVMIAAVVIAIVVMISAAEVTSKFIRSHPTTKMLALCFLLLIGVALVADGMHFHVPRGYLYFAIVFSVLVETLNIMVKKRNLH